jgi:hypothetical protein
MTSYFDFGYPFFAGPSFVKAARKKMLTEDDVKALLKKQVVELE